ncbi:MAG: L7Ae/L30e/S12e/Gadd45 family ribosomal protein [Christensenellales bacterium]|jgi:ribosomal protein L7Ae-like RNA K-turn-binding protein
MNKLYGMLGLCARARRLVTGEEASERLIRSGACKVAFLDESASQNAAKAITNACRTYEVPLIAIPPEQLGRAIGKPGRKAAATADASFARRMIEIYRLLSGVHELNVKSQDPGRNQGT